MRRCGPTSSKTSQVSGEPIATLEGWSGRIGGTAEDEPGNHLVARNDNAADLVSSTSSEIGSGLGVLTGDHDLPMRRNVVV